MEPGDFISIDYIGRIKDTNEIFDLTKEDIAKKENVYNPKVKYSPITVIVDAGFVIRGIDEALKEMKVGEKRTVEIPSDKAFGERKPEYIKLIPLSIFKEQNVDPIPGNYVTINRINGKIISVDGGRVKVDFNHPLAGKTLKYEIEIKNEIKEIDEKIKAVASYFTAMERGDIVVVIKDKDVEIEFKKKTSIPSEIKEMIYQTITKWIKKIESIKFVEIYCK